MKLFFYGGTGQAKVVKPIVEHDGHRIEFVFDRNPRVSAPFPCQMYHDESGLDALAGRCEGFVVCIGGTHGNVRATLSAHFVGLGLVAANAIHRTAFIADSANCACGVQILMRSVVGELVEIGEYTIVNSSATIDHECVIGAGVHIMPGATLAGLVAVGDYATVGSNATILPRVRVGRGAVVGAGAVVTRDVEPYTTVVGNPARPLKRNPA